MYRAVQIHKGSSGWGGPLLIQPDPNKNIVLSVTGGGIHPLAQRIADLTGAKAVDGFKFGVSDKSVAVVVVDCGGTARAGVYPKKGILTVNVNPSGKTGPLAAYITEQLYVSGVKNENVRLLEDLTPSENDLTPLEGDITETKPLETKKAWPGFSLITKVGRGTGNIVNKFYQAARDAVDIVIKNIIPFMAFVSLIIGIVTKSGIGDYLAEAVLPLATTLPGMIGLSFICAIPILSPILGPGAVIAQVVGVLIGIEIGRGNIPPQFALPALFAIDAQVGADFIPVGLALGEAEEKTIEAGVPAILISRLITGPLSVLIAYLASFGLYS